MLDAKKRYGKKFVESAEFLIRNHTKANCIIKNCDIEDKLLSLFTRRGVVRYLNETLDIDNFDDFEKAVLELEIIKVASRDPMEISIPAGVFINGKRVDTSDIFTDNVSKVLKILVNSEYEEINKFLVKKEIRNLSPEWGFVRVGEQNYMDIYNPGGTIERWGTTKDSDKIDRHYGMTYIPNLLWCYTPLYDEAVKMIKKRYRRFFPNAEM
jgi:hypothetical protein